MIRNPKSKRKYRICKDCGKKFTCTEHCSNLWRSEGCTCNKCAPKDDWASDCDTQIYDWVKEWVEEVGGQ